MMRLDPSILISRLCIYSKGRKVYDQSFHAGVNIIASSDNGAGKSTICDFIFFALGGDDPRWKPEALLCDYVDAEVDFSGNLLTLRRFVSGQGRRPMSIAEGPIGATERVWEVFPYSDTESKSSFSRRLFQTLGLPTVLGTAGTNITMHQLLRLMYVDQITGVNHMFRDAPFDGDPLRGAIGSYLCGIYQTELYDAQLELAELERQVTELTVQIKALPPILAEAGQTKLSSDGIRKQIERTEIEIDETATALQEPPKDNRYELAESRELASDEAKLNAIRRQLADGNREVDDLRFESADSSLFIDSLKQRLQALQESTVAVASLGAIPIASCPSCYRPIETTTDPLVCPLCKSKHTTKHVTGRLFRLSQELETQIAESQKLQGERAVRITALEGELQSLTIAERSLTKQIDRALKSSRSAVDSTYARMSQRLGYLQQSLDSLRSNLRLAIAVEGLEGRRGQLVAKKVAIDALIQRLLASGAERKNTVANLISKVGVEVLLADLGVEDAFRIAQRVEYSFEKNLIKLDGRMNFAASSMVVLKNAFHLGLLAASLSDVTMRYPRFLLVDNIEDKGMVPARSHALQSALMAISNSAEVRHQIIYTTAMLPPELEDTSLLIGGIYSKSRKTLDLPAVQTHSDAPDGSLGDP